jgi:hypothetical protein
VMHPLVRYDWQGAMRRQVEPGESLIG